MITISMTIIYQFNHQIFPVDPAVNQLPHQVMLPQSLQTTRQQEA